MANPQPMKQKELRQVAECARCKKAFGAAGMPFFYRVTVQAYKVDVAAIQRQDGLSASMGGHNLLADVMGPNQDMATPADVAEPQTICFTCIGDLVDLVVIPEREKIQDLE